MTRRQYKFVHHLKKRNWKKGDYRHLPWDYITITITTIIITIIPWDDILGEVESFLEGMDIKHHDLCRASGGQRGAGQQGGQGLSQQHRRLLYLLILSSQTNIEFRSMREILCPKQSQF